MSARFGRRRDRWLAGRLAAVDGIEFEMPVANAPSPALCAVFGIDADAAGQLLPGQELHPLRWRGRGALLVAVVDYQGTSIGTYVEFCLGVACTRGRRPWPAPLALLLARWSGLGVYIVDLPVSTEISVKGGRAIWGMAKRRAALDFVCDDDVPEQQCAGERVRVPVGRRQPLRARSRPHRVSAAPRSLRARPGSSAFAGLVRAARNGDVIVHRVGPAVAAKDARRAVRRRRRRIEVRRLRRFWIRTRPAPQMVDGPFLRTDGPAVAGFRNGPVGPRARPRRRWSRGFRAAVLDATGQHDPVYRPSDRAGRVITVDDRGVGPFARFGPGRGTVTALEADGHQAGRDLSLLRRQPATTGPR